MKNMASKLAVMLVLLNLAGCGLKGPLYFPPQDNKPAGVEKAPAPVLQSGEPARNDRAQGNGPTQVISQ
ncbi:LPS translocon maturation chaperone LptM [Entomohabitans teleogrylli]|uniref:LPS translocon maturation chaperone LptM n=1 Tax=Entomohabitans teleogrylli TaxID=1384589 RepID=UPI00073D9DA3|nr:lipoprotein [Entomohabitans teleogrylli]